MAAKERPLRILIDVEHGGFDFRDAPAGLRFFEFGPTFASWDDVWLFHDPTSPLIRGFYYPISASDRYGIPRGQGPRCVLIDKRGDQLWLTGPACGGTGEHIALAGSVLAALSVPAAPLTGYDEMHFQQGALVSSRPLGAPRPDAPPGKTFVHDGRIVCRMEFDTPTTTPQDLSAVWELSTEPGSWLGRPASLTLYDSRSRSQSAGHEGCHLVALGETGRELWLQFPESDTYGRLTFTPRTGYTGPFTQYEAIKAGIFESIGIDITSARRTWRDVVLARHPEPAEVITWP